MATLERSLSAQQKELVAVGASIGAGCHPCISHHLQAGAEAGLDGAQLLAAVTSAEQVTAEAAVRVGDHVRDTFGREVEPALLSRLEHTLAALGATLAANDKTNIERQLKAAFELGASHDQLHQAIETARAVQENASRIHVREAERLLASLSASSSPPPGESCGCGAAQQPVDVPKDTLTTESVSGTTGGCSHARGKAAPGGFTAMMAAFCGSSDDAEEMNGPMAMFAKCRGMFEGSAESQADSTAAATDPPAADGGCGEEAGR